AFAHNLPLLAVNHMAGHIYANRLVQPMTFPLLALVVSGGHTELVYMEKEDSFEVIVETLEDAAGEGYDKIRRVLGLPYPGGKEMDVLAHKGQDTFQFPRAMLHEDNYDFSFSGLKSAVINTLHNMDQRGEEWSAEDLAASFQSSVIEVLVSKTIRAAKEKEVKQVLLAGVVAANKGLRQTIESEMKKELPDVELVIPPPYMCGDNAARIGAAAYEQYKKGTFSDYS